MLKMKHLSPEESFKIEYFFVIIVMTITFLKNRFEELKAFEYDS
jgi:hypothetical protein